MERDKKADMLHECGYNCAQSVACAFVDRLNVDEKTLFRATEALGGGMGGMNGTCGAVSGACVAAGLVKSTAHLEKPDSKKDSYAVSAEITRRFLEENGSLTCRELKTRLAEGGTSPCPGYIRYACKLVEELLFDEKKDP